MFRLDHDSSTRPARMAIVGNLTIYEVRDAHAALLALLEAEERVPAWHLDLAAVEEIDSAGAQLLLALHKHLQQRGVQFAVHGHAAAAEELFELLHLHALLPGERQVPA
ncbi:STAS domain-containing protein [Phytopseudomonas dryadis]|uniref:Anti-anti-sigma factor n=1 Tax=Phytopseudomonas dryadis TaxID=2487520 RepID=A0ABY1Z3G9_9GAMM|nr:MULTISPECIES: STAS domain-containing protein [Pseudomonas]TBV03083.1 anti-anti-sigma factor [Pseudomonas dryadis]TBV17640.1 anti-anti-sigma factor [Pseudomonas sp. FRB 230]